VVHDHLIISRSGWLSLRAEGYMESLAGPVPDCEQPIRKADIR
jgi:hypothetical protein